MKKYIYTKGAEQVVVETDGLGSIDNFMVTGVLGESFSGMVSEGFAFKMGDSVSIAEMLNMAKMLKCKVVCYEGSELKVNESVDYTEGEAALDGTIEGLNLAIVRDEKTYNAEMPADYVEANPFKAGETDKTFPWLVAKFKKVSEKADSTYDVQVEADEQVLTFGGTSKNIGTVSADGKTLTCKAANSLSWEVVADLGVMTPKEVTWFRVNMLYSGRKYTAELYVTPDTI